MILVEVVHRPSTAFATLKEHPRWLVAFLAISTCYVLLSFLPILIKNDGTFALGEPGVLLAASKFSVILIRNLIAWFSFTVLLYYLIQLLDSGERPPSFKSVLSVIAHSNVIVLLGSFIAFLVLLIRWIIGITPIFLETRLIGMNVLSWVTPLPEIVLAYAQRIDTFTVWYLIVVSYGLCLVTGLKKYKSILIVILAWFVLLSLQLLVRDVFKAYVRSISL